MSDRLNELWEDNANWKLGAIYVCKEDPRVVVRKRIWRGGGALSGGVGWTFNFAHRASALLTVLIFLGCSAPFLLIIQRPEPTTIQVMQALILSLMITFGLMFAFSRIGRS